MTFYCDFKYQILSIVKHNNVCFNDPYLYLYLHIYSVDHNAECYLKSTLKNCKCNRIFYLLLSSTFNSRNSSNQ